MTPKQPEAFSRITRPICPLFSLLITPPIAHHAKEEAVADLEASACGVGTASSCLSGLKELLEGLETHHLGCHDSLDELEELVRVAKAAVDVDARVDSRPC